MPAKANELAKIAKNRIYKSSSERRLCSLEISDARATIIPIHRKAEIEGWLSYETLEQLWR